MYNYIPKDLSHNLFPKIIFIVRGIFSGYLRGSISAYCGLVYMYN